MNLKTTLFASLLVLGISSCTKDSSDNDDSVKIRCKIDGVEKTFNANATAIHMDENGTYTVRVIATEKATGGETIGLSMLGDQEIRAGEYREDGGDQDDYRIGVITFTDADQTPYFSDDSDTNPAKITITSITSGSVEGTFAGDVYLFDGTGGDTGKKVVTDGTFRVDF